MGRRQGQERLLFMGGLTLTHSTYLNLDGSGLFSPATMLTFSEWFVEHTREFSRPPYSPDFSPIEDLWDVLDLTSPIHGVPTS